MSHKKEEKKKDRHEDFENLYKRALADYQNLQKQTTKEKEEFARYVKGNLIMEFIPIYENLKTAVDHADSESHDSWLQGVNYVIKQFEDMLANNGVQIINPLSAEASSEDGGGEEFNPAEHESVSAEATTEKGKVDKIVKVVKQGYKIGDKVIQAAKVIVYNLKK